MYSLKFPKKYTRSGSKPQLTEVALFCVALGLNEPTSTVKSVPAKKVTIQRRAHPGASVQFMRIPFVNQETNDASQSVSYSRLLSLLRSRRVLLYLKLSFVTPSLSGSFLQREKCVVPSVADTAITASSVVVSSAVAEDTRKMASLGVSPPKSVVVMSWLPVDVLNVNVVLAITNDILHYPIALILFCIVVLSA